MKKHASGGGHSVSEAEMAMSTDLRGKAQISEDAGRAGCQMRRARGEA